MANKRKKTSSFRMLVTPEVKYMLTKKADEADMSAANYIAALVVADAAGRVRWDSKSKIKTRWQAG